MDDLLALGLQPMGAIEILDNDQYASRDNLSIDLLETKNISAELLANSSLQVSFIDKTANFGWVDYEICDTFCGDCKTARVSVTQKVLNSYDDEVLTPNGDGINDLLVVESYEENEVIENTFF